MQKDVKMMKNRIENGFVSRNLMLGGIALVLTAVLIAAGNPREIIVILTPYRGNPMMLSIILAMMGVLSTTFGYALKR